jgi:catechol 2,3-dioxygenase-like lactoylglutathione lyase family enzyme
MRRASMRRQLEIAGGLFLWQDRVSILDRGKTMNGETQFLAAVPVLASLDIQRSVDFFANKLGFGIVYAAQDAYGIVSKGEVSIHFLACNDPRIPLATGCRVGVANIESLYTHCSKEGIVHPDWQLKTTEWGNREFAILEADKNLVTFFEPAGQGQDRSCGLN